MEIKDKFPYSVRIRENMDQINSEYRHVLHSDFDALVFIASLCYKNLRITEITYVKLHFMRTFGNSKNR